jgi:hypothetical protein
MIKRQVMVELALTPAEAAHEFSKMSNHVQAVFFNELAKLVNSWDNPFCFQLQMLTDSPVLHSGGRKIMEQIGEYAGPNFETTAGE